MTTPAADDETKALIDELRNHPDFLHLPFPKDWYKKYDIPLPKPASFKEFIDEGYWFKRHFDPKVAREIREVAPGGVRPVPEPEQIPVEVVTKPVEIQNGEDNQQATTPKSAHSTESSEKEHLD
jgi:hypothetical protein